MRHQRGLMACLIIVGVLVLLPSVMADPPFITQSSWATTAPVQDGQMDSIYLSYGSAIAWYITPASAHIAGFNYVYILNDANFLYLFFDMVSDNSTESGDRIYLYLDTNNNNQTADYTQEYTRSSALVIPVVNYSFAMSVNGIHNHVQWEITLNLSAFVGQPNPGDLIGYLFGIYGTVTSKLNKSGHSSPVWRA